MMSHMRRGRRELAVVLRSVWWNVVFFLALLLVAAILLFLFRCFPEASFHECLVTALYLARLESVSNPQGHPLVTVLAFLMPLMAVVILGEGVLRVTAIYLGRRRHREEWDRMTATSLSGHVVLCGAGELGRALLSELLQRAPNREVVVVDAHAGVLDEIASQGPNLHHILGDMTARETLRAANVHKASVVVVTSGDDAHNLEAACKALRLNPEARIWVRVKHSGLSELMQMAAHPNLHFFSPYQRAAEAVADELKQSGMGT